MLFTQSALITAVPKPMQQQVMSMDGQKDMEASSNQHACCQQDCERHPCNGECGQCLVVNGGANVSFNIDILLLLSTPLINHSNVDFFYQFRPDNGLRPPIA